MIGLENKKTRIVQLLRTKNESTRTLGITFQNTSTLSTFVRNIFLYRVNYQNFNMLGEKVLQQVSWGRDCTTIYPKTKTTFQI